MIIKCKVIAYWDEKDPNDPLTIDYEGSYFDAQIKVQSDGIWLSEYNEERDEFEKTRQIDLKEFFRLILENDRGN